MHLRFIAVLCASVGFWGCGGEGASTPPPEYPTSSTSPSTSEQAKTSGDSGANSTSELKPSGHQDSNGATNDPPKEDNALPKKPSELAAPDKGVTMEKPADKPSESDVPGANITVGRMEADGVVTTNIECKSDGGGGGLGLLGAVLVTAWISPQKKALDACAPSGQAAETRIIWTAKGGKMVAIEAKGDAKVKACVEKALRPGKPVFDGKCAATVAYGKK